VVSEAEWYGFTAKQREREERKEDEKGRNLDKIMKQRNGGDTESGGRLEWGTFLRQGDGLFNGTGIRICCVEGRITKRNLKINCTLTRTVIFFLLGVFALGTDYDVFATSCVEVTGEVALQEPSPSSPTQDLSALFSHQSGTYQESTIIRSHIPSFSLCLFSTYFYPYPENKKTPIFTSQPD
jgi:hypothetical protein